MNLIHKFPVSARYSSARGSITQFKQTNEYQSLDVVFNFVQSEASGCYKDFVKCFLRVP